MAEVPRRRVLRAIGALGVGVLGGCTGADGGETTTSGPDATTPPRTVASTTTGKPTTQRATETERGEPTENLDVTGTWPMFQYDERNGGRTPSAGGPKADVHQRWSFDAGSRVRSSPAVVGDTAYVGAGSRFYALDLADGQPRWHVEADGPVDASPAIVDGTAFVNSDPGTVYAVDIESAEVRWKRATGQAMPEGTPRTSSPTVVDGAVYVGLNSEIRAFGASSGEERWRTPIGGLIAGAAPAVADGTLFTGHTGGELVAVDSADGEVRWRTPLAEFVTCPPTVHDGRVYVGAADGRVYGVAADTGDVERTFETTFDPDLPGTPLRKINASPAIADGVLTVGSNDYHAYAWDLSSGDRLWRFRVGGRCYTSPAIADGVVHVGGVNGRIHGLALGSGEPLWSFQTGGEILDSSPAVVDRAVCFGESTGRIHLLVSHG